MGEKTMTVKDMCATVVGAMVAFVTIRAIQKILDPYDGEVLWITSPSGKTTRELPFKTALRVIRKRGWHFTPVEPIRKRKRISRWDAFKIFITGGRDEWSVDFQSGA